MPASYRREVEYDRGRTSRVNPLVEDVEQEILDAEVSEFVNPAHVTVTGPHFVTGISGEDYRHVLTPESF